MIDFPFTSPACRLRRLRAHRQLYHRQQYHLHDGQRPRTHHDLQPRLHLPRRIPHGLRSRLRPLQRVRRARIQQTRRALQPRLRRRLQEAKRSRYRPVERWLLGHRATPIPPINTPFQQMNKLWPPRTITSMPQAASTDRRPGRVGTVHVRRGTPSQLFGFPADAGTDAHAHTNANPGSHRDADPNTYAPAHAASSGPSHRAGLAGSAVSPSRETTVAGSPK